MKTILHIGMPKTGSTVLQNCLRASHARLSARGALYPSNPQDSRFNNHRMLIFGFMGFEDLPRHVRKHDGYSRDNLADRYAEFLAHLRDQVATARPDWTILSSETLYRRLKPAARQALPEALATIGGGETRVAVYLRRPSSYYLSALQQRLKAAHTVTPPRVQSPVAVLESYAAVFGRAAIAPRLYDRAALKGGDIVTDFLAAHLPEAGLNPRALTRDGGPNESVSGEAMDVMRRFRLAFHRHEEDSPSQAGGRLLRTLGRIDRELDASRPQLRPEIAEAIDYARPDPLELRDSWGIIFSDLDYGRIARVRRRGADLWPRLRALWQPWRLEEVVALDPALRDAILERLGRSRWAAGNPAHARWIAAELGARHDASSSLR